MAQKAKNRSAQGQSLHVFVATGGKPKQYKGARAIQSSLGKKK